MTQNFALRVQRPTFKSVVRQVIRNLPMNRFSFRMESFLAMALEEFKFTMRQELERVVRQEMERVVQPLLLQLQRPSLIPIGASRTQSPLQLRFVNSLSELFYSGDGLKAKDGSPIMVELIDMLTDKRVTSGPLSSIKIEVVALKGDFIQEDWNQQEFAMNILSEREGLKKLLIGNLHVSLREGLGIFGNLVFTDGSHWTSNRRFRLGARLMPSGSLQTRVKEAKSEAFDVKSGRSKANQKHYPPTSTSEIWRLENIAKNGIPRTLLEKHRIVTVKDFLRVYWINPTNLREMVTHNNSRKNSDSFWETVVRHALTCLPDDNEYYVYSGVSQGPSLLFDSLYKLIEASVDEKGFQPLNQLAPRQKPLVDDLKNQAYRNLQNWIRISALAYAELPRPSTRFQDESSSIQILGAEQSDLQGAYQDQPESLVGFNQSAAASASHCTVADNSQQLQFSAPHNAHSAGMSFCGTRTGSMIGDMICNGETLWSSAGSQGGLIIPNGHLADVDETRILVSTTKSPTPVQFNDLTDSNQSHASSSYVCGPDKNLEPMCSVCDPIQEFLSEALRNSYGVPKAAPADHDGGERVCSTSGHFVNNRDEVQLLSPGSLECMQELLRFVTQDCDMNNLGITRPRTRWYKIRTALKNGQLTDMNLLGKGKRPLCF